MPVRLELVVADGIGGAQLVVIDADDARGKVLYRRRDGDYGLVESG
jgi:hypothetical protein